MRPGSGQRVGSSGGAPPGTGIRPGSGRKPPGTGSRLRTGISPSGPGTQAAQGLALNASVNVMDRPMTGQGVMGMKMQGNSGRIVEDTSYYVGILRKRITDITAETRKLTIEADNHNKDTQQYSQLERKYETLLKSKESLEGQLADYNLALDKTRTSTDTDDVQQMSIHLQEKNKQTGIELDRIFAMRKSKESETMQVEDQIEAQYRAIQERINELEPGKLRSYNDLLAKQREYQEKNLINESRINEINNRIRYFEGDDKMSSHRKEFSNLEKQYQSLKRDCESLQDEVEIANLDPKEAHAKFKSRVEEFKFGAKNQEEKAIQLKADIQAARKTLEELESSNEDTEKSKKEAANYEVLQKRDQEMTLFMDKFDETRNQVLEDQQKAKDIIVLLLESIGRGLDDSSSIITQEEKLEMDDQKSFKEKNLATAKKTMETLQVEKRKREKELELLRSSEPKLIKELTALRDSMNRMKNEMITFQDIDSVRKSFDNTQLTLQELRHSYIKRRDAMRQQVQALSVEHEGLKKTLNGHDVGRELEDSEKRLKHYERSIFDLREFVETKSRETDYEVVKGNCLKILDQINSSMVKKIQAPSRGHGQQAKW